MCATSIDPRTQPSRGFTMVELIAVLLIVGVLAVVAVPRMQGATGLRSAAWRDQIKASVLHARGLAQQQRRVVCLTVQTGEVRLMIATNNPTTACDRGIPGADGDTRWAIDAQGIAVTVTPAATMHLQPDGRITQGINGSSYTNYTISVAGEASMYVNGATGHVQ